MARQLNMDPVEVRYSKYEQAIDARKDLKQQLINLWSDEINDSREWYEVYTELAFIADYIPMDYHDFNMAYARHNPTLSDNEHGMIVDYINVCIRF